ncbi:unnamed protein product [Caenorhabditis sp. 36 PRJEB53466]|nr:unnamed protein product [Caenorhabditis sp. 36 PRJEB53466]
MTATTSTSSHRFASEPRPPTLTQRRDDRIRTFNSFDDITESEEEDIQEPTSSSSSSSSSTSSERSPYAVYDQEKISAAKMRSFSLTNNPFLSPKTLRQFFPSTPRLTRGFSDPVCRRKSSLPTILSCHSPDQSDDFLGLPPIPEATTPASPSASSSTINPFQRNDST